MIVWVIAGLLGLATGLRIGWALVNQQSVVSSAMMIALGGLAVLATLNWPPLTLLIDSALPWPNISIAVSQLALVASAAGSAVMITSVASPRSARATRRLAMAQYTVAAAVAVVSLALFLGGKRQPEMSPGEYLDRSLGSAGTGSPGMALHWLVPLLYVLSALAVASWMGLRLSSPSRRGRALFVFTAGIALIGAAIACFLSQVVGARPLPGVAVAALLTAMAIVAAGSLLPAVEDWVGARSELRLIEPLRREMQSRHPDIGIGVRPRGPLVFRVAELLSLISDSLYLEAAGDERHSSANNDGSAVPAEVTPADQARAVAEWVWNGQTPPDVPPPGRDWLRQPANYSDREWILEIASQYRNVERGRISR